MTTSLVDGSETTMTPTLGMDATRERGPAVALRRSLLALAALGVAGTTVELLLIGHHDSLVQLVPFALLTAAAVAIAAVTRRPNRTTLRAFRAVMALVALGSAVGVVAHLLGNAGFVREVHPDATGWQAIRETLTGATPLLAPGVLAQVGLLGLAFTFRHPGLARGGAGHRAAPAPLGR